jgi:hypothetical protein
VEVRRESGHRGRREGLDAQLLEELEHEALDRVGGHEATGTLFSAVDCEGEPDTAGYFAALQVEGGNYAFFFAVEPPGAFADQLPALQAILDSVRFEAAASGIP